MSAELNPVLTEQLQKVLERFDSLHAILVSTAEGVPLLKVTTPDSGAAAHEFAETVLPTVFAGAAEQVGKLKFGPVQSITAFYGDLVLLHVNNLPLVLTLIASASAQIGALQALAAQLREALGPLKTCVDTADIQH